MKSVSTVALIGNPTGSGAVSLVIRRADQNMVALYSTTVSSSGILDSLAGLAGTGFQTTQVLPGFVVGLVTDQLKSGDSIEVHLDNVPVTGLTVDASAAAVPVTVSTSSTSVQSFAAGVAVGVTIAAL